MRVRAFTIGCVNLGKTSRNQTLIELSLVPGESQLREKFDWMARKAVVQLKCLARLTIFSSARCLLREGGYSPSKLNITGQRTQTCFEKNIYRATIHLVQNLPLTSKLKFRFGLARSGQARPKRNFCCEVNGRFCTR